MWVHSFIGYKHMFSTSIQDSSFVRITTSSSNWRWKPTVLTPQKRGFNLEIKLLKITCQDRNHFTMANHTCFETGILKCMRPTSPFANLEM